MAQIEGGGIDDVPLMRINEGLFNPHFFFKNVFFNSKLMENVLLNFFLFAYNIILMNNI